MVKTVSGRRGLASHGRTRVSPRRLLLVAGTALALFSGQLSGACSGQARAETDTIRFAQQQSIGYLQLNVIKHEHLLEKRAAALGIQNLKVSWLTLSGPDMMNDALLSGAVDVVGGGVPGLLTIWSRTRGTVNEVRGISALTQNNSKLNTNDPSIRSLRDIKPTSRIALPAVRSSIQAVLLQMAAAKEFGGDNYAKFDTQTQTLSPADSTTGLLSGSGGFDLAFTPTPFPALQLRSDKIHTVISSFDVVGESTASVLWTSKRFHDTNPVLSRALLDALQEASDFINQDRRKAVEYYVADTRSSMTVDEVIAITQEPHTSFGIAPVGIEKFANFMAKIGMLKVAPSAWADVFFPEISTIQGAAPSNLDRK
jgi:NitT/TauT family transport system substrate-binding protein